MNPVVLIEFLMPILQGYVVLLWLLLHTFTILLCVWTSSEFFGSYK